MTTSRISSDWLKPFKPAVECRTQLRLLQATRLETKAEVRRVVITGIGAVTAAGVTAGETWDNVAAGRTAIAPIENLRAWPLATQVAAQVKQFEVTRYIGTRQANTMDRMSQFAVVAAREAWADSGLVITDEIAAATQVIVGVGLAAWLPWMIVFTDCMPRQKPRCHPLTIPRLMPNAPASQISMDLGLKE